MENVPSENYAKLTDVLSYFQATELWRFSKGMSYSSFIFCPGRSSKFLLKSPLRINFQTQNENASKSE